MDLPTSPQNEGTEAVRTVPSVYKEPTTSAFPNVKCLQEPIRVRVGSRSVEGGALYGVWCVVCGVWRVVCGVWCVAGVWLVCGWCVAGGVWCVVCGERHCRYRLF